MNLASETIPEMLDVEIHQITQAAACHFEIGNQLGFARCRRG